MLASVGGLITTGVGGDDVFRLRFGAALMLVITYSITVGGLLLPIGSPPNLIGRDLVEEATGEPITFVEWFLMALPIVAVMFVVVIVVVLVLNRPEVSHLPGVPDYVAQEKRRLGRVSPGERNTLIAFAVAVLGWTLPGVVAIFTGDDSEAYTRVSDVLDEGAVAVLAGSNEVTITILVVVIAVLISETTSNTASTAIVVPIAIALAVANGVNPTVPGLAAVFAANYGFMLPVSTPPNAIVYSSGYLPIMRMVKSGAVFDVIGAVLCIVGVAVMARVVGLTG